MVNGMRKYWIQNEKSPLPALAGANFDPDACDFCRETEFAAIDQYVWQDDYRCEARAYVTRGADVLNVLMCAKEKTIHVEAKRFNDPVCRDSCLEFFLQPVSGDDRYVNFEVNAAGIALIGIGKGRHGRALLPALPENMEIQASRHAGEWWAVRYRVPFTLLKKLFGKLPDARMRGNFYTCDETIHPHFGTWNPVASDQPDFHRPECFGELEFVTGK